MLGEMKRQERTNAQATKSKISSTELSLSMQVGAGGGAVTKVG